RPGQPATPLVPYTTLFRSDHRERCGRRNGDRLVAQREVDRAAEIAELAAQKIAGHDDGPVAVATEDAREGGAAGDLEGLCRLAGDRDAAQREREDRCESEREYRTTHVVFPFRRRSSMTTRREGV